MKKLKLLIASIIFMLPAFAQENGINNSEKDIHKPVFISKATSFQATIALRDMNLPGPKDVDVKQKTIKQKIWGHPVTNPNPKPYGEDPVWQKSNGDNQTQGTIQNWEGMTSPFFPPDPSGAVGPNHYVQMINTEYQVFDKEGNSVFGPVDLGSLLGGGNAGDPICMYDKDADRWFLSQFDFNNNIIIAISQTPDPTGEFYLYNFTMDAFPDYPKYAVWQDGYYLTANKFGGTNRNYSIERDKMLVGDPNPQIVGFNLPDLNEGWFFGVLPTHSASALPAEGTPNYFVYMQDDGWNGVSEDHIKVWEMDIDWDNIGNSTISDPLEIPTSPFNTQFQPFGAGDVEQPGTSQKLDAFSSIVMYMAQYREFTNHSSIVMNFAVDVDENNNDHVGIRWVELRKENGGDWDLYQEGTWAPDDDHRWVGSIHMDHQGNIGLAYEVSGAETYLSLRYTGRYANDPLGQMTLEEETIVDGTNSQSNTSRNGDYSQMTIDPVDDATFWFTGEYFSSNQRKTRIASFKIAPAFARDVGVSAVNNPNDGILTDAETIEVTIFNYGVDSVFNFPVSYQVDGGSVVTETFEDTIYSTETAVFAFVQTADLSTEGADYAIKSYTSLDADEFNPNDTNNVMVKHFFTNDMGVSNISEPVSANDLGDSENVKVTINNFGGITQSDFSVYYILNDGEPVEEQFVGELGPGESVDYTFTQTIDLSFIGFYGITSYTSLPGDGDMMNDTTYKEVEHFICHPNLNCSFGDGFEHFQLGTIDNPSGCEPDGFGDFTFLSTELDTGSTNELTVTTGYGDQHVKVWIDFNDNFSFEMDEVVVEDFIIAPGQAAGTFSETVDLVIPSGATLGSHVLRAKSNWQAPVPDDACEETTYGETEEYTVVIVEPFVDDINQLSSDVSFSVNTLGNGRFEFIIEGIDEKINIEIHNSAGQKVFDESNVPVKGSLNYKVNLSDQAAGYYLVKVGNENFIQTKRVNVTQ